MTPQPHTHSFQHPDHGLIPATYAPPISEEVASCAERVASRLLRDYFHHPERIRAYDRPGDDQRGWQALYRAVRVAMGRYPAEEIDPDCQMMDDESISEGIVRAINGSESEDAARLERRGRGVA